MFSFFSKKTTMRRNLEHFGYTDSNRARIEEYFDEHPIPWDLESYTILETKLFKVEVFCANDFKDDYLIKIICNNARLAVTLSKQLEPISDALGLERIIIGKKLFLLRRSFFQS